MMIFPRVGSSRSGTAAAGGVRSHLAAWGQSMPIPAVIGAESGHGRLPAPCPSNLLKCWTPRGAHPAGLALTSLQMNRSVHSGWCVSAGRRGNLTLRCCLLLPGQPACLPCIPLTPQTLGSHARVLSASPVSVQLPGREDSCTLGAMLLTYPWLGRVWIADEGKRKLETAERQRQSALQKSELGER